jgi:fructose-bisphosphate aldolase class 1
MYERNHLHLRKIMKKKVATTVKIESGLYDEFKVLGIRCRLTLQGLVEKCVNRYVADEPFRAGINEYTIPIPESMAFTGSVVV